ncbi:response regulator transcription factor [Streptomyces albogriseolus]|nr:response regulator transcription factor [Streptomyces albogriseolus]
MVRELRPDVVLMDVRMPGTDGIRATETILAGPGEPPRIVVVTTFENDAYVYDALRAGAAGFLLKRAEADALVGAVRLVARSDTLLFPEAVRALAAEHARARPAPPAWVGRLTGREREVLRHMARRADQRGDRRASGRGRRDREDARGVGAGQDGRPGPHAGRGRRLRGGLPRRQVSEFTPIGGPV